MTLPLGRPLRRAGMIPSAATALHALSIGPVQVLLLGFKDPEMHGRIRRALEELLEHDMIRIIDRALVQKDADGNVMRIPAEGTELEELGAIVDSLIAVDEPTWLEEQAERHHAAIPEGAWFVTEKLPKGSAAVVLIIEHRWARPLQYAVVDAGGFHIADAWIHPVDVAALGLADR